MPNLNVKRRTVDMQTGETTAVETVAFDLMPAQEGTCPECGTRHDPEHPHNARSLFYQYHFYAEHERWPTWADAMAHCDEDVRSVWRTELERLGVDINGV